MRSATARRIGLRVDPARGNICLVVPKRGSERAAWKFADDNRAWIEQRLARMEKPVPFLDGTIVPVFGHDRRIRIVKTTGRTTSILLHDDELEVRTPREDPSTNIRRFLEQRLHDIILPLAREKAAAIKKEVVSIQLRDTRTRWGSCSSDGKMMLCWRLVFAPMFVIDYVVAHEVAHLKHMNHGNRFWALCEALSDDFQPGYKWLDVNGDRILKYGMRP